MKIGVEKISNTLYISSLWIYLLFMTLTQTMYFRYFQGVKYIFVILLVVFFVALKEVLMISIGKSSAISILWLIIISVFLFYIGGNELACTGILVYASRDRDIQAIIKISSWFMLLILIFVIVSSQVGVISDYSIVRGGHLRHYLGFRYSLYPAAILLNVVAGYLYCHKEDIKTWHLLFFVLVTTAIYLETYAKLATAFIVIIILLTILEKKYHILEFKMMDPLMRVFKGSYVVLGIFSFVIVSMYNSSIHWMNQLNYLLESRLELAKNSLDLFGFGLFKAQNLSWQGNGLQLDGTALLNSSYYLYVDNFYMNILQQYGLVFTLMLIGLLTLAMINAIKRKDFRLALMLVLFSFHGLVDNLMLTLYYNIFLIAIFYTSKSRRSESYEK